MTMDCSLNYKFNIVHENSKLKPVKNVFVQKLFLTFRTIFVHNMFSPCSEKRRGPDKDLPVQIIFFSKDQSESSIIKSNPETDSKLDNLCNKNGPLKWSL